MLSISLTDDWRATYPDTVVGVMEMTGVGNDRACRALDERKRVVEADLGRRYGDLGRPDLLALPVMAAYNRYYRRFNKTYHVLLQVESIAFKGRSLPNVSPAVDANFMAEVETFVLTAGHDVAKLRDPVVMDVSREDDHIVQMNGGLKQLRPGDMIMRDAEGVSCSVIYGQDDRSPISPESSHLLYIAYATPGVPAEQVELQLRTIEENLRLCSPAAVVEQRRLLSAGGDGPAV